MDLRCRTSFQRRHKVADEGRYRHTAGRHQEEPGNKQEANYYMSPEPGVLSPCRWLAQARVMTGPTSDPHPSELRSGVLRNRVTYGTVRIWIEIQFYADEQAGSDRGDPGTQAAPHSSIYIGSSS